jgi:hypothetical protein
MHNKLTIFFAWIIDTDYGYLYVCIDDFFQALNL